MSTETISRPETIRKIAPKYRVLLHNDDHNSMEHVVQSLVEVIGLTQPQAVDIMMAAHASGCALVITCVQEHAEFYCEGLQGKGLTSTIEPES